MPYGLLCPILSGPLCGRSGRVMLGKLDKMPPGLKQEPHATRKLVLCAGCAPQ
jgi:hypothetical protein